MLRRSARVAGGDAGRRARDAALELASAKAESAAKNDVWNAAAESDFRFMHLWLEASLPLDPLDEKQQTPLMAAAREGGTYMCALLISRDWKHWYRREDIDKNIDLNTGFLTFPAPEGGLHAHAGGAQSAG